MENEVFEIIGKAKRKDIFYFFKDRCGKYYYHHDFDYFLNCPTKFDYLIKQVISKTVFIAEDTLCLKLDNPEENYIYETLIQFFKPKEESLVKFVKLIENSMRYSDLWKFGDCYKINKRVLLPNFGGRMAEIYEQNNNRHFLVEATFSFETSAVDFDGVKIFLQNIADGVISHEELTPELYYFSQRPEIKAIIKAFNDAL